MSKKKYLELGAEVCKCALYGNINGKEKRTFRYIISDGFWFIVPTRFDSVTLWGKEELVMWCCSSQPQWGQIEFDMVFFILNMNFATYRMEREMTCAYTPAQTCITVRRLKFRKVWQGMTRENCDCFCFWSRILLIQCHFVCVNSLVWVAPLRCLMYHKVPFAVCIE